MADDPDINLQEPKRHAPSPDQQREESTPVLRTELLIPQAVIDQHNSEQKEENRRERWKLRVEVATLIAILIYTTIAGYQGCQMRRSTEAAEESAKAAANAVAIADATRAQNREAVEKTLAQGKSTLEATIENFHRDQRAWIGPTLISPPRFADEGKRVYIQEGATPVFGIRIKNSGKTPARKVKTEFIWGWHKKEVEFLHPYPAINIPKPMSSVFPDGEMQLDTPVMPILPKEFVENVKNGTNILRVYGYVNYEDIFGIAHRTTFCNYLSQDLTAFALCNSYNDAD